MCSVSLIFATWYTDTSTACIFLPRRERCLPIRPVLLLCVELEDMASSGIVRWYSWGHNLQWLCLSRQTLISDVSVQRKTPPKRATTYYHINIAVSSNYLFTSSSSVCKKPFGDLRSKIMLGTLRLLCNHIQLSGRRVVLSSIYHCQSLLFSITDLIPARVPARVPLWSEPSALHIIVW